MVVRIKSRTIYSGSVTPSALNTETNLISVPAQPDIYLFEAYVDIGNLASGETALVRLYLRVDGSTERLYDEVSVSGDYPQKVVHITAMNLRANAQARLAVVQTAGTLRAFPYWGVVMVYEEI
jgi:hypothetical protein